MENFIVSARKYRPATFDMVVGQPSITRTLKNAIRNKQLAQAFLFCGPRGIGKTTCARILAKTINCENITENIEACDQCESCRSFNQSASFNIHELDAASHNSVDDIRSLVDQVRIPPQVGNYKVYIIDEVHMLSQAAFNAFLKTLEEPPDYAKFILATTEKHKIIPTILSRCQIFDFMRIGIEDIAKQLAYVAESEGIDADSDALHIIAQKADGAMRDALSMFDQIVSYAGKQITYPVVIENLNVLDYDYYFRIIDYLLDGDIPNCLLTLNEIIDNGFDGQHFIIGLGEHLRNLLVCKDQATVSLMEVGANISRRYLEQSQVCSVDFLLKALGINNKCDINYKGSNNKRLHMEIALMQMCSIIKQPPSDAKPAKINTVTEKKEEKIVKTVVPPVVKTITAPVKVDSTEKDIKKIIKSNSVSIKDITNGKLKTNGGNGVEAEKPVSEKLSNEFTDDQLQVEWLVFVSTLKGINPNLHITLTNNKPVLKGDFNVGFVIDNKVQEDEIRRIRGELLGHLRSKLKNDFIQLETEINSDIKKMKPYTPSEKFKKLAEKNPAIKKLKDQLDLEIDF
jgi:DNA polymerase-3 subunit gamma/tau